VLARHAESLFWAGRYLERAEDTARLLDVTHRSSLSARRADALERWEDVVVSLRLVEHVTDSAVPNEIELMDFLVLGAGNPGAITESVLRLRENFRSVREVIPTELWEQTNRFHLELSRRDLAGRLRRDPFGVLTLVRERCQSLAGIAIETMMRDEGYRFMILGQALERAMMATRILGVRYPALLTQDFDEVALTLRAVSGLEAFRRVYRSSNEPRDVAEFLLLSSGFPRGVLYCLHRAEDQLAGLDGDAGRSRPRRLLGQLRARLEFSTMEDLIGDLIAHLDQVEAEIAQVADSIGTQYFRGAEEFDLHSQLLLPGEARFSLGGW
jgi:uncharacterized alpha-E superfamily protein